MLPSLKYMALRFDCGVEKQLGYKMVKCVETEKTLGKSEGGKNEDDARFDILPNI